jgi:glycosyltransferase involved in cell wall biosynthesis
LVKIAVCTGINVGGPYLWGKNLVKELQKKGYEAEHRCTYWSLFKTIFRADADIIHTTVPLSLRFWSKPVILTVKGDYRIEKRLWRPLYPLAIRFATKLTCSTKYLQKALGLNRAVIIPNAVDLEKFKWWRKHKQVDILKIVTMTKFRFEDKARGVVKLASLLHQLDFPIEWTILGGGEYLDKMRDEVTGIVQGKFPVRFLGHIDNPEKELPNHDVFLYYSTHDSFATAVIESLSCGLPVITNNYGPTEEVIHHGKDGLICNTDKEFIDALNEMFHNWHERKRMGINARNRIKLNYSWDKVVSEYIEIYKNLLGRKDENN